MEKRIFPIVLDYKHLMAQADKAVKEGRFISAQRYRNKANSLLEVMTAEAQRQLSEPIDK